MAIVIKKENQNKTSQQNAEAVNKAYGNDGAPDDPYDRDYTAQSAKGYTPKDTTTVNNSMYYAKEEKMSNADRASLTNAGVWYNDAKSRGDTAAMEEAHALAEQIRGKYGYSGGTDGSEYIKTEKEYTAPSSGGGVGSGGAKVDKLTNRAPDLTGLLNSWLDSAKQQQENKIDYAVNQGVNELQRAEEDAQAKFQTQQNQVDENEAKALDNQALYAEARGDRGGIGQAQYAQIQATAMTNRRTINSARTKLATDTARQIADLRARGEFQKADAVLELSQTYLSQLMDLEKWGAEFNLDVDKFNSQIDMWQAEFDASIGEMLGYYNGMPTLENQKYQTSVDQWNQQFQTSKDQWNQEFNYNAQQNEREFLANSGLAALSVGIRPSAAQQAAMGYTDAQVDAELAAYKLAQAAGVNKGSSGSGGSNGGVGGSKPRLTAAQTLKAIEDGILNESVLAAYEYWYGQPYDPGEDDSPADGNSPSSNSPVLSEAGKAKLKDLLDMEGQIGNVDSNKDGSPDAIANAIATWAATGEISITDAEILFKHFGIDPSEWIEY